MVFLLFQYLQKLLSLLFVWSSQTFVQLREMLIFPLTERFDFY